MSKSKKMLPVLSPSEFVALCNQTLEVALPLVEIEGEVLNFKLSKNRWVYFDIADEDARLRCFGTVYMLPAPVEDGMKVRILAAPRLHPQFNFSLNLQSLRFSGQGSIKKASDLLYKRLDKEGLFAPDRKRPLPYPPARIALVTSIESAAYRDFIKVLAARYGGLEIQLADVQVQGEAAPAQIVQAVEWFNKQAELADVLVLIRGGGSADDLQAFSSEQVTRAVAASRIPTMVAIGHETDISLAELAADQRASTPSNAAELLVPDRRELLAQHAQAVGRLESALRAMWETQKQMLAAHRTKLSEHMQALIDDRKLALNHARRTLEALSPQATLRRGYAIVRLNDVVVGSRAQLKPGDDITLEMADGKAAARVQ